MLSTFIPEGYQLSFEEHFFNTSEHRKTQSKGNWKSFYWLSDKKQRVLISWHLCINGNLALSPVKATFGGLDFKPDLQYKYIKKFVAKVLCELHNDGLDSIRVVLPPEIYNQESDSFVSQALLENGFQFSKSAIDATIPICKNELTLKLHRSKKRKLKKCTEASFRFAKLNMDRLSEVYDVLYQNRSIKGYRLSMSLVELSKLVTAFPERFRLYGIYDDRVMIAAACCIRVRSDVLYIFYAGHLADYDLFSPITMLYQGIYNDCQSGNISLMDLGTSVKENGTDHKLLISKLRMGAKASLKTTWQRQL